MNFNLFRKKSACQFEVIDKMVHNEHTMFDQYSGLKIGKTINIINVPILLNGKEETIHTTRSGDDKKEDLVLVHGYFLGLVSFLKMVKDLSEHYRVWCLDLVGMGLSSRPEFTCKSTEETVEYFVECIEKWREKVGIDKFYLGGHSCGGYLSGMYALKYPQRVKKLILISPAAVSRPDSGETAKEILNGSPWLRRQILKCCLSVWQKKLTLHDTLKYSNSVKSIFIKISMKLFGLKYEEIELFNQYIDGILKLPESTLKCLHYILTMSPIVSGFLPLEDKMHMLKMPCEIYFGEKDWVSTEGAYRVVSSGAIKGSIHIIPNAGHVMNFENPKYLTKLMIDHLSKIEGQDEALDGKSSLISEISETNSEADTNIDSEDNE